MDKLTLTGVSMATFLSAVGCGGAGPSDTSPSEASQMVAISASSTSTVAGYVTTPVNVSCVGESSAQ